MNELRVGIIGLGRVSQHYLKLYESGKLPKIRFVACYDSNASALQDFSSQSGIKAFDTAQDLINSTDVDAIFVLTPSGNHFEIASQTLAGGKPTLIEKPLCLRVDQAFELLNLAKINGVYLQSILQNRYNAAVQEFLALKSRKAFNVIISAGLRLRWGRKSAYYEDGWHGTWEMDGGVVSQQAIHHIFALDQLVGPISSVHTYSYNRKHLNIQAEDTVVGTGITIDGVPLTIELTTAAPERDFEACISVLTDKGVFEIGGIALNTLKFESSEGGGPEIIVDEFVPTGYGWGHITEISIFAEMVLSERPLISLDDSIRALRLVHAIYCSIETKSSILLADSPQSSLLGIGIK